MSALTNLTVFSENILRHHVLLPLWVTHLGGLGVFAVAVIDASVIPLPLPGSTDLLLLWMVANRGAPFMYALYAITGSALGGYSTWQIGKRGGEAALRRSVPIKLRERLRGWVQKHPVLSVFIPALLPPPIPLLPFALAAGVLGVTRRQFLIVFGCARSTRYALIAILASLYGKGVVHICTGLLQRWSTPIVCIIVFLMLLCVWGGLAKIHSLRKEEMAQDCSSPRKKIYAD